ncbi:hypothetical protein ACHAWF_009687 [Thalassiosira exigua]
MVIGNHARQQNVYTERSIRKTTCEQAICWMHTVCGYPVKSTYLKPIKAEIFQGRSLLTECNVQKYNQDTNETPKGHLNQTRKNVRSTKTRPPAFAEVKDGQLHGKKIMNLYTSVYDVHEILFSNQTVKFRKRSFSGNRYVMVAAEINNSAILEEPLKN